MGHMASAAETLSVDPANADGAWASIQENDMIGKLLAGAAVLLLCSIALPACARTAPASAPAGGPGVVHVAPPTGEQEADRASILAALERVVPGGTVQFAAGTYLVGEIISITTPEITLLGHREGTTLRGCDDADFTRDVATRSCNGLELGGRRQTVRNITFENVFWGLHLGCCWGKWSTQRRADGSTFERPDLRPTEGGHLVEGNTFRRAASGIRVNGDWSDPAIVRHNRFIDNWHAISINGHTVHLRDNEFSVPEPQRVPFFGFPWDAISIRPPLPVLAGDGPQACIGNVVAGNRIEGYIDGLRIETSTPGSTCRDNVIRDNTIVVARVLNPDPTEFNLRDPADSTFVGVPISLTHDSGASGDAGTGTPAALSGNVIEGNRIIGAEGIALEVRNASGNRIANNTIVGVRVREPYPGNTMGGRAAEGLALEWREANGSGIWVSPGSEENEIVGNTFEEIAAHAIVLEGDRNRVELRSANDRVVDLAFGNRVSSGPSATVQDGGDTIRSRYFHSDGRRLHYLDFGGEGLPLVFVPALNRTADTFRDFAGRFTGRHRVLAVTNRGSGESEGQTRDQWDTAGKVRDVIALLDTLGVEHAVVLGRWADVPIYLAENHADRVAGIVILSPQEIGSSWRTLRAQDPTGVMAMIDRWALTAVWSLDPDQPAPWDDEYEPRYLRSGGAVAVPALAFRGVGSGSGARGAADPSFPFELAERAHADPESFPDAVARAWFQRLRADSTLRAEVRAFHENVAGPASEASERAFQDAFGDQLRIARLDLAEPITGYEFWDQPELFESHIRSFLAEIARRERAASPGSHDTVHVAAPTGEQATDRASILAALDQVRPGGIVQFAPGTYLVGELITVAVGRITLLGHPDGTTLRGCERDAYAASQADAARAPDYAGRWTATSRCGLFELTGGHVTIGSFTFEQTRLGLILGCCYAEGAFRPTDGGYLIEDNTFRNSDNGIRPLLAAPDTTVIRGNRFINTFHAVSSAGSAIHVLGNDISVPQPARVPAGHPGFAIGLSPIVPPFGEPLDPAVSGCEHNVVAGNRIEGHETGIVVFGDPGTACRRNVIRDNTIIVRRVPLPPGRPAADLVDITDDADTTIVGVPLTLHNPTGEGVVAENVIERNRVFGADGIGIELLHATGNRIVDNTITGVRRRDPFPGNTLGGDPERWRVANGSGIWISAGSDGNEIAGNTFEDMAAHAVVIEGDRNRVELRSGSDAAHDLGSCNRVVTAPTPMDALHEVAALTERFLRELNDETPMDFAPLYAADAVLVLEGGTALEGRDAIVRDFFRPYVARIRGVLPMGSRTVGDDRAVTVTTTYSASLAPSTERVEASFSNTWARQPDGRWQIASGTFALPGDTAAAARGPIRDGIFHSGGVRLHYLDFGGEGLPIVFLPVGDRTAYTYMEFAPRFTDRNRAIVLTLRGSGSSAGMTAPAVATAVLAGDVVALLDSLGIDRAVVAGAWQDIPLHLAEEHPDRIAGVVFLGDGPPDLELRDQDPIGFMDIWLRSAATNFGLDPDQRYPWRFYTPRYLRTGAAVDVPALWFIDESGPGQPADAWEQMLARVRWEVQQEQIPRDSVAHAWYQRLLADEEMQARGRAFWRDVVGPAAHANGEAFQRAFGDRLRRVPVARRAIGYGYRDAPELIEPHIRRFLEDLAARERRRSAGDEVRARAAAFLAELSGDSPVFVSPFAPRFTDRNRVLAVTSRGTGESDGDGFKHLLRSVAVPR
jgi:uncharacterized protein (TIGR02246 family)